VLNRRVINPAVLSDAKQKPSDGPAQAWGGCCVPAMQTKIDGILRLMAAGGCSREAVWFGLLGRGTKRMECVLRRQVPGSCGGRVGRVPMRVVPVRRRTRAG